MNLDHEPEAATTVYAGQAKELAEKLHYAMGIALSYAAFGNYYQNKRDYTTAINFYRQAINVKGSHPSFYSSLLNLYFYLGDYPNAMKTVTEELIQHEKTGDPYGIAHCNNLLGYIYCKQENFEAAEKYYAQYIQNTKELNDSSLLAHALGEIADLYTTEKKFDQSFRVLFDVLKICDGENISGSVKTWLPQYKAKALYRLSRNFKLTGDLQKALQYALKGLDFGPVRGVTDYDSASYFINLGDIYKELKQYDKAVYYLDLGFAISSRIHHKENLRDAAEYLAGVFARQKKYDSAYFYYHLFAGLKDSIVNNETKMKIAGIQGQYDLAKKDQEIARQQQFRNILIGGFILLLVSLLFLYNRYRLMQKNKYQQELNRQQNELFNAIASAQEQERKRLAQDIHDSLGSLLSAAKLKMAELKVAKPELLYEEKFLAGIGLLDEASSELRNISHNIMPATLSKLGLAAALKNLCDRISSYGGLQFTFLHHGFENRLDEQTEISIYRIILELINNVVKHASATKLTVQLIKFSDTINITIEDNGKGFDYKKAVTEKHGLGLGSVLARIEYLKGKVHFDSGTGKGTTVILDIPLPRNA